MRNWNWLGIGLCGGLLYAGSAAGALVAAYGFEEGSGTTAIDSAGGDHNGTLVGAQYVTPGIQGSSALSFDGVDDTVNLGAGLDFIRNAPGATLAAWITPSVSGGNRSIISVSGGTNAGQARAVLQFVPSGGTDNRLRVGGRRVNSDGFQSVLAPADTALQVGQTYHVAAVLNYQTEELSLYINGGLVAGPTLVNWSSAPGNSEDTPNLTAAVGSISSAASEFYGGVIDDAMIFDEALTGEQIAALVPEPGALGLLGAVMMGLMGRRGGKK